MKKKISWILFIFMLLASFQHAARTEEMAACAVERQAAGEGWRLTGRIIQTRMADCKDEPRYENLFRGTAVTESGSRAARGAQILLGLIVLALLLIAGGTFHRRKLPSPREPVRMRAVRYIHFAYSL